MEVIEYGKKRHKCDKPGWLRQKVMGLRHGAIIKCTCGKTYVLDSNTGYWQERYYGPMPIMRRIGPT